MPRVSVFTPSHRTQYLDECLACLQAQSFPDWEWIVVLNAGAGWRPEKPDDRVRVLVADDLRGVGALKQYACRHATGDFLLELDHDDLLVSDCLEQVVKAFDANPEAGLVFSDTAQISSTGGRDETRFSEAHGWTYREEIIAGQQLLVAQSMAPTPHNVSYIWYAPNHVRAFRRTVYEQVGGYDPSLDVLDDQDIMCRLYQAADFVQLRRCLYLQRMHERNTQRDEQTNQLIQGRTVELYDRHVEANALAWAKRNGLKALDMGAAHNKPDGYLGVDQYPGEGVDIVGDVTSGIPLPDNSVGVIRAVDFLEHVVDKIAIFNELYRVLAPNGMLLSLTPSTDGRGAYQDPTHVAFYNENSFWYFTDANYSRFVPQIECRFQVSRLVTYFPSDWHQQHSISYVAANLIAIKDEQRNGGVLLI